MENENNKIAILEKVKKIEWFDILIFVTICMILGGVLIAFYPAIMTADSNVQWEQTQTGIYHPWHPIFHTFLEFLITRIWNSPTMIAIVQILVFAIALTLICKVTREKEDNIWLKIVQLAMCIVICIIPVNFLYSVTLWKDILYSFSLLLFAYYILKGIKIDFKFKKYEYVILAILFVCICLIRHNGLVIIGLTMLILFFHALRKKYFKKYVCFALMFLILLIIGKLPEKLLPIQEGNTKYTQGVFLHMTGALLANGDITDEADLEVLNEILDIEIWKNNYTPITHNTIIFCEELNEKALEENGTALKEIVIKYALQNPMTIIKHYFNLTKIIWDVRQPNLPYIGAVTNDVAESYSFETRPISQKLYETYVQFFEWTQENKITRLLFYTPAVQLYLSIILIAIVCKLKNNKKYLLVLVPMIFNAISLLPAIPAPDYRYQYINMLTLCVAGILLGTEYIRLCKDEKKGPVLLYLLFGGITTVINVVTYGVLASIFHVNYLVSNVIAWILAVLVAYITNKLYVFDSKNKSKKENSKEFITFLIVRILSLGIDMVVMFVGITLFAFNDILVKILSNVIVIIANYFMSKYIVFRKKEELVEHS